MTFKWTFTLVFMLALGLQAKEKTNRYVSESLGIAIDVPVSEKAANGNQQLAFFFLPPSGGFAANVNIIKQAFGGSIKEYDTISQGQFKNMKWTIVKRKITKTEIAYEYKGAMQGKQLHWYARAVKSGKFVYLVTATCLESRWADQKAIMIKSVNSFKVK